jgi:hypothetical protein
MTAERKRAHLQTYHALQASDLAAAMNDAFKKVRLAPGDYSPELTAPEGPSTAGGVQAMQHLRLVAGEPGQPTLVMGHANHAEGKAELRTYECLDAIHRERFHRPLALDRTAYDAFLSFATQVFGALHLQTTVVGPATQPAADAPPAPQVRRTPKTAIAAVAAVAAVAVALAAVAAWAFWGRG